jgi:glycosyltransferase involved in cell wall biosynthesis
MQQAIRSPSGWLAVLAMIRALRAGARAELAEPGSAGPPVRRSALVHAHWWLPAGLAAPPELPSVVTLHGTDGRILGRNILTRWLGRRVLRRAGVVTAVSPELARTAEAVSGRSGATQHVQPMPVETSAWPWGRGGAGLLVIGRLTSQKRVHLAIQAAQVLAAEGLPIPLTIIGDGPERSSLERESRGDPVIEIRFLGSCTRPEVIARLESADVLIFPSVQEGFGLSAIEALMIGVPVVACTDGGGIVSALNRHGGGTVADPAPRALAQAIRQSMSGSAREGARGAGARWREELAPDRVAQRFEGWYAEALAR